MADPKKSLFDDLTEPRTEANNPCKVRTLMMDMDDKDRGAMEKAIDLVRNDKGQGRSRTYSAAWLTQVLRNHGHSVSTTTIIRHLSGACSCG